MVFAPQSYTSGLWTHLSGVPELNISILQGPTLFKMI